jgi:hypothetical protein
MRQTEISKHRFKIDISLEYIEDVACNELDYNQKLQKNRILKELKKIHNRLDKLTVVLNNKKQQ